MDGEKYDLELNVAVRVVHMVCSLCQKVQKELLSTNPHQVKSKDDDSPVTVAGIRFFFIFNLLILLFFLGLCTCGALGFLASLHCSFEDFPVYHVVFLLFLG